VIEQGEQDTKAQLMCRAVLWKCIAREHRRDSRSSPGAASKKWSWEQPRWFLRAIAAALVETQRKASHEECW